MSNALLLHDHRNVERSALAADPVRAEGTKDRAVTNAARDVPIPRAQRNAAVIVPMIARCLPGP